MISRNYKFLKLGTSLYYEKMSLLSLKTGSRPRVVNSLNSYKVLKFNQFCKLKTYIDFNTLMKAAAKSHFEETNFKLISITKYNTNWLILKWEYQLNKFRTMVLRSALLRELRKSSGRGLIKCKQQMRKENISSRNLQWQNSEWINRQKHGKMRFWKIQTEKQRPV